MRAAVLPVVLASLLCQGCFTLLGAALDSAATRPRPGAALSSSATQAGAEIDARIAGHVAEDVRRAASSPTPSAPALPARHHHREEGESGYLCSITHDDGTESDAQMIDASSLERAVSVCAAFNDLEAGGACICHGVGEDAEEEPEVAELEEN